MMTLTKQDKRTFLENNGWHRKGSADDLWGNLPRSWKPTYIPMEAAFQIAWKTKQKEIAAFGPDAEEPSIVDKLRTARSQAVDCGCSLMSALVHSSKYVPFEAILSMTVREFIAKIAAHEGVRFVYEKPKDSDEWDDPK